MRACIASVREHELHPRKEVTSAVKQVTATDSETAGSLVHMKLIKWCHWTIFKKFFRRQFENEVQQH